jgi:hypothetical protein
MHTETQRTAARKLTPMFLNRTATIEKEPTPMNPPHASVDPFGAFTVRPQLYTILI